MLTDFDFEWTGAVLVPSRVLRSARAGVARADLPGPDLPSDEQLVALLEILGYVALGSEVLFDGTIPERFKAEALGQALPGDYEATSVARLDLSVAQLRPAAESIVEDASLAATLFEDHLDGILESPIQFGQLRSERTAAFYSALADLVAEQDTATRIEVAQAIYESGTMGGKLLLGLVAAEEDEALTKLGRVPESLRGAVLSHASTVFRSFLLATWAPRAGALYSALPTQATILEGHRRLLWKEIERAILEAGGAPPAETLVGEAIPLVGAAVLMDARDGDRPADLFVRARELGDRWDTDKLQKALIAFQNSTDEYGVSEVGRALRAALDEYQLEFSDPARHGLLSAKADLIPGLAIDVLLELTAAMTGVGTIWAYLTKKGIEPERVIAFLSYGESAQRISQRRLRDKVRDLWRAP